MKVALELVHEREAAVLALWKKADVPVSGKEDKARVGLRLLRRMIDGQLWKSAQRNQVAAANTHGHLCEKCHGDVGKLVSQPFVCVVIQVFVPPQHREPGPVSEAGKFANRIVAFMMRQLYYASQEFGAQVGCLGTPLWIQVGEYMLHHGDGEIQLEL